MWLRKRIGRSRANCDAIRGLGGHLLCFGGGRRENKMRGILVQHHQISPNPLRKPAFSGSFALLRADGVLLHAAAPWQGFLRSSCLTIRAEEGDVSPPPTAAKKHSREELIAFFRDIQTSIAMESPKTSRRTRKPLLADPFEEVARRQQSFEELNQDGQPRVLINLEDMKVAELRELARSRRMRGYSKLKKAELLDRLKGVSSL